MPQFEQIRKAVVAFFGTGIGSVVVTAIANGDFSTTDGLLSAAAALLVGIVTYRVPNST